MNERYLMDYIKRTRRAEIESQLKKIDEVIDYSKATNDLGRKAVARLLYEGSCLRAELAALDTAQPKETSPHATE